ncbi:MAG TPA: HEAT repeat domain-containing protein [Planctomycetota bacterium]|nr:HEAT repeat domain-containing protein [Planctomycetota bacterium]
MKARVLATFALLLVLRVSAASQVEPPPDPGFEVSVHASDVIAEIEILAGTPFRAIAAVRKVIKGEAPKVIELEGFNSFTWDTVHKGFSTGSREIVFLSKTGVADVFSPLTPAAPRLSIQPEGVMLALGDPPFRVPVKKVALEEGIALMLEASSSGKVPEKADAYLRRLWDEGEIESRYLCVAMAGALRDPRAAALVAEASRGKLLKLRLTAIEALGNIGTSEAVNTLRVLLKDEKPSVAREAARVLCNIRETSALPDMLEWVRRSGLKSADTATRTSRNDQDKTRTEAVAIDVLVLALEAAPLMDHRQISRALLDIARSPNDKLARGALAVLADISQKEEVPAIFELADDATYPLNQAAAGVLQRVTLKSFRDASDFKKWWGNMGAGFNEDVRRDHVEAYARSLVKGEDRDERRNFIDLLKAAPGEMALPAAAPLLLNPDSDEWFGSDDLVAWKTPLALPYLLERLGRDNNAERRGAQAGIVRLCLQYPRLREILMPLLRAGLSESDSSYRRSAQLNIGVLSEAGGIPALIDAMEFQGGYEASDASKALYSLTARTLGYGYSEPAPDQAAGRGRLRGWWEVAQKSFKPLALYVPGSGIRPIRILRELDPAQRNERLESAVLGADCRTSGAAFMMLLAETKSNDPLWTKLATRASLRDRAHAMLGMLGESSQLDRLKTTLSKASGDDAEAPLLRALTLVACASIKDSGPKAIVEWLKIDGDKAGLYWKRLAIVCLGLADGEAESLKALEAALERGLAAKAPDPLAFFPEKPDEDFVLFRAALLSLCARADGTPALMRVLKESESSSIRELCARELSLRRHHAAAPLIVKALERADRYEWHDLCRALNPLLKPGDGTLVAELLNAADVAPRSAGAFLLAQRPDVGTSAAVEALLVSGLTDSSAVVRYYCAEALGKRNTSAVKKLTSALADDDEDVRAASAEALARLGDLNGCTKAAALADNERRLDQRWLKAMALGGGAAQLDVILKLCGSTYINEQRAGLEALGVSSQAAADDRLLKTFRNDESAMQTVALEALAARGNRAVKNIQADLEAPESAVRARAALLLSRVNGEEATKALKALLNDKDESVQMIARFALERRSPR